MAPIFIQMDSLFFFFYIFVAFRDSHTHYLFVNAKLSHFEYFFALSVLSTTCLLKKKNQVCNICC